MPCHIIFNASQQTPSGTSLNDILAKGKNNMNKLVEIAICWSKDRTGFHPDIKKMNNTVQLRQEAWCLQHYIWQRDIDKHKIPEEKFNQNSYIWCQVKWQPSRKRIKRNSKIDCLSGENMEELALEKADQLELVLN